MTAALSMCKYYTFNPPAGHLVTPAQADVERTGDRVWHPRARPRPAEALWAILAGRSRAAGPSRCPPAPAPALRRPRPGLPRRPPPRAITVNPGSQSEPRFQSPFFGTIRPQTVDL